MSILLKAFCIFKVIPIKIPKMWGKDGGKIGGSGVHFPCTWVKHLPILLRNKVNKQQYPRVYEDRRPKSIEDTEKTYSKGIASGQKVTQEQQAPGRL